MSYAFSFQLLFEFISKRNGYAPSQIQLEDLDVSTVLDFLTHLQEHRGNGARTRNARLAAIRSFMRFIEHRVPAALGQVHQILAIPSQRVARKIVRHLNAEEVQAILGSPDPATRLGVRDRAMLHLAVAAGLRVSELVGLRLPDVEFRARYLDVAVRGKGRKERALTLWKTVAQSLRAYLDIRPQVGIEQIFLSIRREPLTRSGFEAIVRKHARAATTSCPSLSEKRVSPHVLRHTCALNLLQATSDLRKVALWLGHESIQTTEIYLQADPTLKLDALTVTTPPSLRPGKFEPVDRLLQALREGS